MVFEVGETVVYPHHGAAKIEEIKMRTVKGEEKMYLKLKVAQGDLTIEVPAENVDLVGVRDVVGKEGLEHVFDVLRAEFTEEPTNWSRRYKANLEKLASGDVIKVAEVVRDLWRRDHDRGLSAGEKRMLSKARQILIQRIGPGQEARRGEGGERSRRGPRLLGGTSGRPRSFRPAPLGRRPSRGPFGFTVFSFTVRPQQWADRLAFPAGCSRPGVGAGPGGWPDGSRKMPFKPSVDPMVGQLVVEHREWPSRFGFDCIARRAHSVGVPAYGGG